MALIVAAVGAGFIVAVLFQGSASADGVRNGSGGERHQRAGVLVELTVGEGSDRHGQQGTGVGDRERDAPLAPLARAVAVVVPGDATSPTVPARSSRSSSGSVPLPRVGASVAHGTFERGKLQPGPRSEAAARVGHRPVRGAGPSRPAADPLRLPRPVAPGVASVELAGDSSTVGLITAPLPHVAEVVGSVPIRPIVDALRCVADAVLPPALGVVTVPTAPRLPAPPAPGFAPVPVTDATSRAAPVSPVDPVRAPVRSAALPAPPPAFIVEAVNVAAPTGHRVVRRGPAPARADLAGRPVAPADQDAAGINDGSTPGPGLVWPVARQSPTGAEQFRDLVPLVVGTRFPSVNARPG
ncbi:hypothetical protein ACQEUX_07775 [Micromonospora sp. CA-259024]|uniref:hypothetical protein n=1 Tax=Micromonospora sp. CA-259024 TaxID=3239965 RepID=UPI003D89B1AE